MHPTEWQASPRHVRIFHGATSTVIDWQEIAAALRTVLDHPVVVIAGITFEEQDLADTWRAMVEARERQRADELADQTMGMS